MITLKRPPSINQMYGFGSKDGKKWRYKRKHAVEWTDEAFLSLKEQKAGRYEGRLAIYMKAYFKQDGDIDNVLKATLDCMQLAKVYENDSQIHFLQIEKVMVAKREEERIEIEITEEPII